jgi:hypothetical protein
MTQFDGQAGDLPAWTEVELREGYRVYAEWKENDDYNVLGMLGRVVNAVLSRRLANVESRSLKMEMGRVHRRNLTCQALHLRNSGLLLLDIDKVAVALMDEVD